MCVASLDVFRLFQEKLRPDIEPDYYWLGLLSGHVSLSPVKLYLGELVLKNSAALSDLYPALAMQADYTDLLMHWVTGVICLASVGYALRDWRSDAVKLLLIAFFFVCASSRSGSASQNS